MPSGNLQQCHNEYIYLGSHNIPGTHSKRFERIIRFPDHLSDIFHTPDKNYIVLYPLFKKQIIISFKNKWGLIYRKPLPAKWLPDQEDVISRAWDPIEKYFSNHHLAMWGPSTTCSFAQNTTPLSYVGKPLAVRVTFDLWGDDDNSKKLLLMNPNKVWNQKELRETCVDRKALDTYLKIKTRV